MLFKYGNFAQGTNAFIQVLQSNLHFINAHQIDYLKKIRGLSFAHIWISLFQIPIRFVSFEKITGEEVKHTLIRTTFEFQTRRFKICNLLTFK